MANFGDPLWGGSGTVPGTPFTFPPGSENDERGNIDIDQVRAIAKSGGKSVFDSQFVTTVGTRTAGHGGVWDALGNWIDSAVASIVNAGSIVIFVNGTEVATDGAPLFNSGGLSSFTVNGA